MNDFRTKTCCFTGHRELPDGEGNKISARLRYQIDDLYSQGYRYFGVGGAIGFDTLVAEWLQNYRESHPLIRIIGVYPFKEYRDRWTETQRARALAIDMKLDKIVYCCDKSSKEAFLVRDRHLVDCSSVCISYCTRSRGGTAYTVRYALEHGVLVYNTASFDIYSLQRL